MLITHTRQFRLGVADGFVTANYSIDRYFSFRLKLCNSSTRVAKFACETFCFQLSLGVLARGAIAFTRQAIRLLRQAFERGFELPRDLAHSFRDGRLREQFRASAFDLNLGSIRFRELFGVRIFSRAQQQRALVCFLAQLRVFLLQAATFGFNQHQPRGQRLDFRSDFALALLDLAQLLLLIDALTRLPIASQHRFRRGGAGGCEFIFEVARFLRGCARSFFSLTQIVSDAEFEFGDLG